jgi:hypothetical protein
MLFIPNAKHSSNSFEDNYYSEIIGAKVLLILRKYYYSLAIASDKFVIKKAQKSFFPELV